MYIYLTSGTPDFMQLLELEHPEETMISLQGEENTVLLHETVESTIFESPRKYEILDQSGELHSKGFFVFNNIPVTDEGRPIFEQRFQNRARAIENEPGFVAIRVMRPLNSDTYIILTEWSEESAFKAWQSSQAYNTAHKKRGTDEGIDKRPNIFAGPTYVKTYTGVYK